MRLRAPLVLAFLWVAACGLVTVRADDDIDAAARLLDAGWNVSGTANRQVDELYRNLPSSPHIDFAYALVKLRQFRNEDAIAAVEPVLNDPVHGVYARRMRIWLLTMRKRYSDALVDMERLVEQLPDATTSEEAKETRREMILFLGRVAGYLRGPAEENVTDFEVESRVRRIVNRLTDEEKKWLEAESLAVLDNYRSRVTESEKTVRNAKRAAEEEKKRKREQLAALREKLNEQITGLEDQQRRLNEDAESELERIGSSDQPLRNRLASLETQSLSTRNNIAAVWIDISILEDQMDHTEDPVLRSALLRELSRLWNYLYLLQDDLARLDNSAAGVHAERSDLAAQQQQLENRFAQRTKRLGEQRENLEEQLRRVERDERKLADENVNLRRTARNLDAKSKALNTYLPFPAEAERERLLARGAE